MYLMAQDKKALGKYCSIKIERNLGGKKEEKYCIVGTVHESFPEILGKYPTEEEAMEELLNIAAAMQNGSAVYAIR